MEFIGVWHPRTSIDRPKNKDELEIGTRMPDGTIYAGVSSENGKRMYVTPRTYSGLGDFNAVAKAAKNLDECGHKDWKLPQPWELDHLSWNKASIAGFNLEPNWREYRSERLPSLSRAYYWACRTNAKGDPYVVDFLDHCGVPSSLLSVYTSPYARFVRYE